MKNHDKILVLNSGSSSLKIQLFDSGCRRLFKGMVDAIGKDFCSFAGFHNSRKFEEKACVKDHSEAVSLSIKKMQTLGLLKDMNEIKEIGHRVVHGGEKYKKTCLVNDKVITEIRKLSSLAPLHNPPNLKGILACRKIFPKAKQYAVFDTAFHTTIPKPNFMYGIPLELYEKNGIRKYGFHGISHEYVSKKASGMLKKKNSRIVVCHLGNGSSITAVKKRKSVDTSMGLTPLDGVLMGTRPGHIDPGVVLHMIRAMGYSAEKVDAMLNKESGFKGVAGMSDMRELKKAAAKGDKRAELAIDMLAHDIVFYIAGYAAMMGGLDCIVFTAGIGENEPNIRGKTCGMLSFLGVSIDDRKNMKNAVDISAKGSKVKVFVMPTDEELAIAEKVAGMVR